MGVRHLGEEAPEEGLGEAVGLVVAEGRPKLPDALQERLRRRRKAEASE